MRLAAILTALTTGGLCAQAAPEPVTTPSGLMVTPHEVLSEEHPFSGEMLIVVRLIAPGIASPVLAANLQADMEWACTEWGIPAARAQVPPPAQIVVELMTAPVPRGQPAPEITQFFETYRLSDGLCIWELF